MNLLVQQSTRLFSTKVKKIITRVPSDVQFTEEQIQQDKRGPNDTFIPEIVNRNPRNLEELCFERKNRGWDFDKISPMFWNKLVLERHRDHLEAKIVHYTGKTVLSASSNEDGISSQIKSPLSAGATEVLAKVLARRCLESGILFVHASFEEEGRSSPKTKILQEVMAANGISLKEPLFIFPRYHKHL